MTPNKYAASLSGDNTSALRHTGWHVSHEKDSPALRQNPPDGSYSHSGADKYRETGY